MQMLNCEVIVAIENTNLDVKTDRLKKMLAVFENVRCLLMFFILNYHTIKYYFSLLDIV